MGRFTGLLGLAVILGVAYLLSTDRRKIQPRILAWGLGLQLVFAVLVLKTPLSTVLEKVSHGVAAMFGFAKEGSTFLFGALGAAQPPLGFVFAFQVLPIIIFIASFFAILYHLGIMQVVVKWMAIAMQKVMGVSGAESLDVAASIFMGQTEAPLTIRPFLKSLTDSELFTIMTCGMAHVSGAVMAAYVEVGKVEIKHLLTAVIMTAPATILLAKMLVPETEKPVTAGKVQIDTAKTSVNVLDAAGQGASDGLRLALNIAGALIAFLALIAMINGGFAWVNSRLGWFPSSMAQLFGWVFAPVAWILGVPWQDAPVVGGLMGTRLIANEMVAFEQLGKIKAQLLPQTFTIATFALCGFANLSSIAIQIGGIGALEESLRPRLARMGFKAVMAGTMANFMSACIAGIFL